MGRYLELFSKGCKQILSNVVVLDPSRSLPMAHQILFVSSRRIQYRRLVNGNNPKGASTSSERDAPILAAGSDTLQATGGDSPTVENPSATTAGRQSPIDDNVPAGSTLANEESNTSVPAFLKEAGLMDDKSNWTAEQFQSFRLTDARLKRLEEIGFCWSAREGNEKAMVLLETPMARNSYDDQWDAMFAQLKAFKQKTGDCLVPKRYQENPKLGTVRVDKANEGLVWSDLAYRGPVSRFFCFNGSVGRYSTCPI